MDFNHIHPRDIHKGDRLWESGQYGSVEFIVKEEPIHEDGKWKWVGITSNGEGDYLITDGYEHYGPRIYKQPVYSHNIKPLTPELSSKEKENV